MLSTNLNHFSLTLSSPSASVYTWSWPFPFNSLSVSRLWSPLFPPPSICVRHISLVSYLFSSSSSSSVAGLLLLLKTPSPIPSKVCFTRFLLLIRFLFGLDLQTNCVCDMCFLRLLHHFVLIRFIWDRLSECFASNKRQLKRPRSQIAQLEGRRSVHFELDWCPLLQFHS